MPRKLSSVVRAISLLVVLQSASSSVSADVIVLKTGERLDAKIISTTDTAVEAEVRMSASITDVRTFQKSDIADIEKPDPAEAAFEAARLAGPGPNSIGDAAYGQAIEGKLQPFVRRYPASSHVAAVNEMIAALQEERKRVIAGDVKIENEWFTPTEVEKQKEQISGMLLFQKIKTLGQAGDTIGALNEFLALEKTSAGTKAYPKAVDYALQLIGKVQKEIVAKTAVLQSDLAEREKGLSVLPDYRKAPLLAAAAAEDAKVNASLDGAAKAGQKWTPIYPRNKRSIEDLQKTVTAEASRLSAIKTAPMHASIAAVAEAQAALTKGDVGTAKLAVQKATTLWSANLSLKEIAAAVTLAEATPAPTPTPSPTVSPTPAPKAAPKAAQSTFSPAENTVAKSGDKPPFLTSIPGALTVFGGSVVLAGGISWYNKLKDRSLSSEG